MMFVPALVEAVLVERLRFIDYNTVKAVDATLKFKRGRSSCHCRWWSYLANSNESVQGSLGESVKVNMSV